MSSRGHRSQPSLRHVSSINDLTNAEIERVFAVADDYLAGLADARVPHKIGKSTDVGGGRILATLFFEPSTRTRLSFESAMLRLGGRTLTSADPATSSASKGESLADSVRVVSNYADAIVLRHPRDGAARLAAQYAHVPVINGGDGAHEHPTQTLCDLYTLRRENRDLRRLNVAVSGDLRGSRTIHSFVYALARFDANLFMMPAKGMELPEHVARRLREEFNCMVVPKSDYLSDPSIDALYVTPEQPNQLALIPTAEIAANVQINRAIDAVYVTRFQKERWATHGQDYPRVDRAFLDAPSYGPKTKVMHPLPRVGELDIALDDDSRAIYFKQASYGVPVRMALISLLLGLGKFGRLAEAEGGFPQDRLALYDQPHDVGIRCANPNCIVNEPHDRPYTRNRFHLVTGERPRLRCWYCEADRSDAAFFGRKTHRPFAARSDSHLAEHIDKGDLVAFAGADEAAAAGFGTAVPGGVGGAAGLT